MDQTVIDTADMLEIGNDTAPWMIKDFPVSLREAITRAARQADCRVADWLVGHFQRHGLAGVQITDTKLNQGKPGGLTVEQLVSIAANPNMPAWLRMPARRELGAMLGVAPPPPPPKRLQAPAK